MKVFTSVPSENLYFQETTVEEGNVRAGTEMGIINVFDEFEYQSIVRTLPESYRRRSERGRR